MRNDTAAMIPSPNNPYTDHRGSMPVIEVTPPAVVTMRDIDTLVRLRLDEQRREMREETRRECEAAWEDGQRAGHRRGVEEGVTTCRRVVGDVVRANLNHISRRMTQDRAKSSIASERKFIREQAFHLQRAIDDLSEL